MGVMKKIDNMGQKDLEKINRIIIEILVEFLYNMWYNKGAEKEKGRRKYTKFDIYFMIVLI